MLRRLLLPSKRPHGASWACLNTHRTYSIEQRRPTKEETNAAAVQDRLSGHASEALKIGRGFLKLSAIGIFVVGATVYGSLELGHQYVERKGLQKEVDEELAKYEWDQSEEVWQGDASAGGTDPGLGRRGRHAVRAAWMALNWGVESPELHLTSISSLVNAQAIYAILYLESALQIADSLDPTCLHPFTKSELHRLAGTLSASIGRPQAARAKEHFLHAWEGLSGQGVRAARVALNLGDTASILQQDEESQKWWATALQLCDGSNPVSSNLVSAPTNIPASPWAQRIIASTLVSLSSFYAHSGKLREAEKLEESALSFLRSIPSPDSINDASSSQALHALYLLQKSALLSIHLAEVLHAQKKPVATSVQYLTLAATSSERVARALVGLPMQVAPEKLYEDPAPQGDVEICSNFSSSNTLSPAATRLYRDAQRSAAEAWNLLGVLYEQNEGASSKTALLCYQRAVRWAGEGGGSNLSNDATTEEDWLKFWADAQRAQDAYNARNK